MLLQAERAAATNRGWAAGWNRKGKLLLGDCTHALQTVVHTLNHSKQWFTPSTAIEGLLKH